MCYRTPFKRSIPCLSKRKKALPLKGHGKGTPMSSPDGLQSAGPSRRKSFMSYRSSHNVSRSARAEFLVEVPVLALRRIQVIVVPDVTAFHVGDGRCHNREGISDGALLKSPLGEGEDTCRWSGDKARVLLGGPSKM